MTPSQVLSRVRDELKVLVWPGTTTKVFGSSVYVVPETPMDQLSQYTKPCAFILDQGDTSHPEHQCLMTQKFSVMVFVENVGKNYGEGGVLSRNRTSNTSDGAGSKDLEEVVLEDLVAQTVLTSKITLLAKSRTKPQIVSGNHPLLFVHLSFEVFCWTY